ncbi:WhiB family transcriptional regulator, redox-sensing transcriptional regulator [Thermomonospora echinospora]|uniref:Transcriptional regulator WhiB n=1 Tax=Thermomonospora echinospora TaxID=1992 RepID=A0A1H6CJ06_9ACTN|nr:WhiB family transcriptional regulator [Thermomonospora echinospora]SEG72767.1 WhiB family transcriptional regulator, redox-sensing transcriptional regulator [Thermomonospora echinospora]
MLNPDKHWTDYSACRNRGVDPELFYPINYTSPVMAEQVRSAKSVCAQCPVRAECLDWALRAGEPDGIWGGTTPEERRYLRRPQRTIAPAPLTERPAA